MQIISGKLKGLILESTTKQKADKTLRPTTGYSKQVLFNLLNNNKVVKTEIEGKLVLDGFAGTGAVGIEFFSRGAAHITFVDSNLDNVKQLKVQTTLLGVSSTVLAGFLPKVDNLKSKFDVIFLDPPYDEGKGKVAQTVKTLLEENLNEDGIIILETLNQRKELAELKKHLAKKEVDGNIIFEKESGSKTQFLFFKNKSLIEPSPLVE